MHSIIHLTETSECLLCVKHSVCTQNKHDVDLFSRNFNLVFKRVAEFVWKETV